MDFINLREESIYLKGARDLLLRLQDDFDMYLVPCAKFNKKDDPKSYEYFPITNTKQRKLIGEGFKNALLSHRESLVRFLQGDYDSLQVTSVERDKKGKVTELKIEVI